MICKAHTEEKNMFLNFEENCTELPSKCSFKIGEGITSFIWCDPNSVNVVYNKMILEFMKAEKGSSDFNECILNCCKKLDAITPYLHFYTNELVQFMLEYDENKLEAFNKLKKYKRIKLDTIEQYEDDVKLKYYDEADILDLPKHLEKKWTVFSGIADDICTEITMKQLFLACASLMRTRIYKD